MKKQRKFNVPLRGKYLDRLGNLYGVKREPKEHDEDYRKRIITNIGR